MSARRIPSLDGLRAIAVGLVVVGHASMSSGFPAPLRALMFFNSGHLGVSIFFVISGFLITSLMVQEQRSTGRVSLRDFYIRRTIRIFPAAYLYIAVVLALAAAGLATLRPGDWLHAITYTMNYHHDRAWALGHLWSLGVEEQFYLLWPVGFLLLGERRSPWLLGALILTVPVVRVLSWIYLPAERIGIEEEFQFVCDGLATGALLALLVSTHGAERLAQRVPRVAFLAAPFAVLACSAMEKHTSIELPLGVSISNIGIALVILWCIVAHEGRIGRVLNSRAAVFLGTISYSLYLWQQLVMDPQFGGGRLFFPLNVVLAFAAAVASYFLVEARLLALRQKYRR